MGVSSELVIGIVVGTILFLVVGLLWRPVRRAGRTRETLRAIRTFRLRREQLEARFLDMARAQGKPRGLRWLDIHWLDRVTFARDLQSGLLTAFAAINIRFEAIEGGDMEDVKAVDTVRDGSALFHYQHGQWGTGGRALFNMNPEDALVRLAGQYEPVTTGDRS